MAGVFANACNRLRGDGLYRVSCGFVHAADYRELEKSEFTESCWRPKDESGAAILFSDSPITGRPWTQNFKWKWFLRMSYRLPWSTLFDGKRAAYQKPHRDPVMPCKECAVY